MLAFALKNYWHIWQLPLIILLLVGWILGGGWMLQSGLKKVTGNSRIKLSKGLTAAFLISLVGGIPAIVVLKIATLYVDEIPGVVLGSIFGAIVFLGFSYLLILSMVKVTAAEAARVWAPAISAMLGLGIAVGLAAGLPAYSIHQDVLKTQASMKESRDDLLEIYQTIRTKRPQNPPVVLQELVDEKQIDPKYINHSKVTSGVGYFYRPARLSARAEESEQILACDWATTHKTGDRMVLFVHGRCEQIFPQAFDMLLAEPVNADFAKALQKAESAR